MRKCGCVRGLDRAGGEKPSLIKGVWTVRDVTTIPVVEMSAVGHQLPRHGWGEMSALATKGLLAFLGFFLLAVVAGLLLPN